jgi:periplasmic protein CpxP/Spy
MMSHSIDRKRQIAFVAALAGAFVASQIGLAGLGLAAGNPGDVQLAQAAPRSAPSGGAPNVEQQLSQIRSQLHITPQQQAQFDAFAQAMRQNFQEMQSVMQREQQSPPHNAVEQLQAQAQGAQAEAAGLQRLEAPFQALYASLSPTQKRDADQIFAGPSQGQQRSRRR